MISSRVASIFASFARISSELGAVLALVALMVAVSLLVPHSPLSQLSQSLQSPEAVTLVADASLWQLLQSLSLAATVP